MDRTPSAPDPIHLVDRSASSSAKERHPLNNSNNFKGRRTTMLPLLARRLQASATSAALPWWRRLGQSAAASHGACACGV